jgi:SAM-dependent methyltransferase
VSTDEAPSSWDGAYASDAQAPWDIGRPQPAFVRLADLGLLRGLVLDAGCGTGEHALLAAARGADVVGVDISPVAIGRARAKAAERGVTARFEVGDVLQLGPLGLAVSSIRGALTAFDTVIDSGVFHVFDDSDRVRYVSSLASALRPGGTCYLMCFSDRQPGDAGPRRVSQDELRAAFTDGWSVDDIAGEAFDLGPGLGVTTAQAWLATIRRL